LAQEHDRWIGGLSGLSAAAFLKKEEIKIEDSDTVPACFLWTYCIVSFGTIKF